MTEPTPIQTQQVAGFNGIWTYPARGLADVAIGGITSSPTRNGPAIAWSGPYFQVCVQGTHGRTPSLTRFV
jgi:hypothetical protein